MKTRVLTVLCSVSALALLTACIVQPQRHQSAIGYEPRVERAELFGNVSDIQVIPIASRNTGGGAVLGMVLGAVVGSRFGGGNGRIAGAGVGAVGGALIGNHIEERNRREDEFFRVMVHFDNGGQGQFDYQRIDDLRVGDRVKAEGGQLFRV